MEKISSFTDRFNAALRTRNITAAELCRRTGVSEAVISQYKKGLYEPKDDRLSLFSRILNVSEAWLSGYDTEMDYEDKSKAIDLKTSKKSVKNLVDGNQVLAMRYKFLREANNISIEDAAKKLDVSKNALLRWENGDGSGHITNDVMALMKELYHTNYLYLLGYIDDPSENADCLCYKHDVYNFGEIRLIAVLDEIVKTSIGYSYGKILDYKTSSASIENVVYIRIKDNSLSPVINQGDFVLVNLFNTDASDGGLMVVDIDRKMHIRKVYAKENYSIFQPINLSNYDDIVIPHSEKDRVAIIGKVVCSLSEKQWK